MKIKATHIAGTEGNSLCGRPLEVVLHTLNPTAVTCQRCNAALGKAAEAAGSS